VSQPFRLRCGWYPTQGVALGYVVSALRAVFFGRSLSFGFTFTSQFQLLAELRLECLLLVVAQTLTG
jgi:hypothetical protein